MKGGKLLNVNLSTISSQGKKFTDAQLLQKWKTIDWNQVEKSVNKLQTRITKAVKQNKWNLVKRLQYLLTHSYFAKLLAVRRVTQNKGKRTSGIDGEKWLISSSKMKAVLRPRHRITSADIRLDILIFTIRVANQSYNK